MEATAFAHARGRTDEIPVRRMIGTSIEELRTRAERIVRALPEGRAVIEPGESVTGGGSLPGHVIETVVLAVSDPRPDALAAALRSHDPPVIARVEGGRLMLDLRTVAEDDDPILVRALGRARTGGG
jgi:L-seryl-tRNA(Ser) seleniumtransferase